MGISQHDGKFRLIAKTINRASFSSYGVWNRCNDPCGNKSAQLAKRNDNRRGKQRSLEGKLRLPGGSRRSGTLQVVRHKAKSLKEAQHKGHAKKLQRRRLGLKKANGKGQGRKASTKLGRTVQDQRSVRKWSIHAGNSERRGDAQNMEGVQSQVLLQLIKLKEKGAT
ncbi:hypothetical protein QL285_047546 [Trifolium repens]|nr:hypothetical protein QL285_047546 [Trifolium repens]